LVLVYINLAAEPQKVTWTFKEAGANHPPRFKPWVTNDEDNLKPHPAIDVADGFQIPPRTIVTLVGE